MNRLNVMLTRCKKGMVIVANKDFLATSGSHTLVADFASHWKNTYGHAAWADWKGVADASVDVPGVPAPNPRGRATGRGALDPRIRIRKCVPWDWIDEFESADEISEHRRRIRCL